MSLQAKSRTKASPACSDLKSECDIFNVAPQEKFNKNKVDNRTEQRVVNVSRLGYDQL